jgi:FtsH-binding integral membrane protein
MVVNIFLASSALQFAISVIGVLVFTGLTAWDTQRIKEVYLENDASDVMAKKSIMGARSLYLNFINLFVMLLQLFGNQRS